MMDVPSRPGFLERLVRLVGLALFAGVALWVLHAFWSDSHPAEVAAGKLEDHDPDRRIAAIRELERFGQEDPGVGLPALCTGLKDADPRVRAAAAMALVMVVHGAGAGNSAPTEVQQAVAALFNGLLDQEAEVRAASIRALWMIDTTWGGPVPALDFDSLREALNAAAASPDVLVRVAAISGLGAVALKLGDDVPAALPGALEDASEDVRKAAVNALCRFRAGLPRLLPSLVRSFEKTRPEFRAGFAAVLERVRPRAFTAQAVPALIGALDSPDAEICLIASTSLAEFRKDAYPAIPVLISGLGRLVAEQGEGAASDPGQGAARAVAQALLKITADDPSVGPWPPPPLAPDSLAVLEKVLSSGTPELRSAAARLLSRFRPQSAFITALNRAVGDPVATVRVAALQSLHDIGDSMPFAPSEVVGAALEDESPQVRFWAAGALGHAGLGIDPFVPALLRHTEHDADPEVRSVCAEELRDFVRASAVTPGVVPVLIQALQGKDPGVQCAACGLLARLGPVAEPALPSNFRLLEQNRRERAGATPGDHSPNLRSCGAAALGGITPGTSHSEAAVSTLMDLLGSDNDPAVMLSAIEALSQFGPAAHVAIPRLRSLSGSPNQVLSATAQRAIETINAAK